MKMMIWKWIFPAHHLVPVMGPNPSRSSQLLRQTKGQRMLSFLFFNPNSVQNCPISCLSPQCSTLSIQRLMLPTAGGDGTPRDPRLSCMSQELFLVWKSLHQLPNPEICPLSGILPVFPCCLHPWGDVMLLTGNTG